MASHFQEAECLVIRKHGSAVFESSFRPLVIDLGQVILPLRFLLSFEGGCSNELISVTSLGKREVPLRIYLKDLTPCLAHKHLINVRCSNFFIPKT